MKTGLKIIGLSGTNGSGKDTVGEILAEHHNYFFVSVTDVLRDELRRRGLSVDRENLRTLSAEWRREHGLAVLVDRAVDSYKAAGGDEKYDGLVMASLRNPAEAGRLHELGGSLIWVDADPRVRYERVQANAASRARAEEDVKTFEEFLAEQEAEMHPPAGGDAATLNMSAVRDRADITLENNSDSLDAFRRDIEAALEL